MNRHANLDEWIARDAVPFSINSRESINDAFDKMMAALGDSVELLGFGEALHGGRDILNLRNRLFERLVTAHGYSAIAVESSFPRGHIVNEYVAGRGRATYEAVQDSGFSHGFGQIGANRELVEWMRRYNADADHPVKLRFYGFDSPTEMMYSDSPRHLLTFVLDYLTATDQARGRQHRERIEPLLGQDADWENQEAAFDPTKSVGLTPAATALRVETEELIATFQVNRPELVARSDFDRYWEAMHYASVARQLLTYHAAVARSSSDRLARLLGIRDAMMADNLAYFVARECRRGKVLAFAHNYHLKRGTAEWRLGAEALVWWPAGAHLGVMMGPRYAVIGSAIGVSDSQGIAAPEAGTLEAMLTAGPGPARFIATRGAGLPAAAIANLPTRTGSAKNASYFPLTAQSFTDYDGLVMLDSMA